MTGSLETLRGEFKQFLISWLEVHISSASALAFDALVILWLVIFAFALHVLFHVFLQNFLIKRAARQDRRWAHVMLAHGLFRRLAYLFQGIVVYVQAGFWLDGSPGLRRLIEGTSELWILLFGLLAFFSVLDWLQRAVYQSANSIHFPLRGLVQTIKLVASVFVGLLAISALLSESPVILLSGFGALSAVLLLVFKDPVLGLVAGIQLSANQMLSVGDWLEMPKYGADGDVIDIALTTVKVRNWDKTITTIPTYALISDSFKNWRGMSEAGGRRIKRSVLIETSTIQFLTKDMLQRLKEVRLIADYLNGKVHEIEHENQAKPPAPLNRRRLTNVGTFRAYLLEYLKQHPRIRQDMTLIVRQLDPTSEGLPIQVYAFTTTTNWNEYEDIQSDIFDHILSILPEFGLRAHEAPTGNDMRSLAARQEES